MRERKEQVYQRLKAAQEKLGETLEGAAKSSIYQAPAEGEWSITEILAHVCEVEPVSIGKMQAMCRQDNPDIGRSEEETRMRVQFMANHAQDRWEETVARLNQAHENALKGIQALPAEYLLRPGRHPRWGDITVHGLLERIADHIEEHAAQIEETLAQLSKG